MDENDLILLLDKVVSQVLSQKDVNLMTDPELEKYFADIRLALANVDAEKLLRLERVSNLSQDGASLGNGIRVKTIHDEILPHTNGVRYIHVKEVMGLYSIGVFVFPPRCVIPLHNHPGMTVLSRILYGSIQVKSFDIICTAVDKKEMHDTTCTTHHDLKDNTKNDTVCTKEGCKTGGLISRILSSVARSISNDSLSSSGSSTHDTVPLNGLYTFENDTQELKSPQVTALYPRRGNVHEFKAGPEGAALLDVLIPPYDSHEDRDCTFYEKVESLDLQQHESCWCDETGQKPTKCWLVPIEQPEWFRCSAGQYKDLSDK